MEDSANKFFSCPSCGGNQHYGPEAVALVCDSCGASQKLELHPQEQLTKLPYGEGSQMFALATEAGAQSTEAAQVICSGCEAEISVPAGQSQGECAFCGTRVSVQVAAQPELLPQYQTPFALGLDEAKVRFRQWLKTRRLAPGKLKRFAVQKAPLKGIYYPFWAFDADTSTRYRGEKGVDRIEHYTTTDSEGKSVQRTKTVTDWYPASGSVRRDFRDLTIAANTTLSTKLLEKFDLADMIKAIPYDQRFQAGFNAIGYSVPPDRGFEVARQLMEEEIRRDVKRDIGGNHQRIHSMDSSFDNKRFSYLLLPFWSLSYKFRTKVYRVLVDGLLGKVSGERPYSPWKIALLVLLGIGLVTGLVFLFLYLEEQGVFKE